MLTLLLYFTKVGDGKILDPEKSRGGFSMQTFAFGYPRIGKKREYKKLLEGFWKGEVSKKELFEGIESVERGRIERYAEYVDIYPKGEMTLYDRMLDTSVLLGIIPERFLPYQGLETYFEMARGKYALELTKWFNTNYHYLVPEIERGEFSIKFVEPIDFLFNLGKSGILSLIGPFTFLRLSKALRRIETPVPVLEVEKIEERDKFERIFEAVSRTYISLVEKLSSDGEREIIFEEPSLVTDTEKWHWDLVEGFYKKVSEHVNVTLLAYYDGVSDYDRYVNLPVKALLLDFVSNKENYENLKRCGFPSDKTLIAGVINGRQVWRANLKEKARFIEDISKVAENIIISNSCPLYHLPVTVSVEDELSADIRERLSFADEKLEEIRTLRGLLLGEEEFVKIAEESEKLMGTSFAVNEDVRRRVSSLKEEDFTREKPYSERVKIQKDILNLPPLPTTTIGSFPQTEEVRKMRTAYRSGKISQEEYDRFIKGEIEKLIKVQEDLGLDVFVHGEFERTDMVEFFAQKLDGIATTKHGWVISYGSRVYRPPIIYGDVSRPEPMTLKEITYAQSLTDKPVKGMLTGPVTILNWSFYRDDVPKEEIAYQIALALQEEVRDLEEAGIKIIQIDEPAFREGAPLKRNDWKDYFEWAVKAFRLASRAKPETQIHTHMCYSEFNEIIDYIYEMDFDVISIEASRSKGEIISAFESYNGWDRQIGIGVYDIHSPAIPEKEEIKMIIERVLKVFPSDLIWINPDCGLKTRRWEEVIPALRNMVEATKELRKEVVVN